MNNIPNQEAIPAEKKAKLYFSNLNGVRAVAALMVVISHVELHKIDFNLKRFDFLNLATFGKIGVTIFFSLSGFLITYLLLEEKRNFSAINFKAFYMRRILRIWPLYFLVVVIGFFIFPRQGSTNALLLSIFFLPNLAFCLKMLPAIFDPIWSIGTEEQFYIFHPHFFRIKKLSNILYTLLAFIVFVWALGFIINHLPHSTFIWRNFNEFFYYARFDNMMIGAVVAVLYYNTKHPAFKFRFQRLFNLLFNKTIQVTLLTVFIVYIGFYLHYHIPHGDVLLAILFSLLIINLCEADTSIVSLKGKSTKFIGEISYGIYLLHKFPLFAVLYLVEKYMSGANIVLQNITIYVFTFAGAIGLASLSYYGYEKHFLNIKKRFQKITQH